MKPFPMQKLVHLAQQKSEAAARRFGQLNAQRQEAQTRLESLHEFRREYQARFQSAVESGMDPFSLRNFEGFIQRLDEAIAQQRAILEQAQNLMENGRLELLQAQRKLKSFDTLEKRHIESERKAEEKQEQRRTDEHSSRAAAVKLTAEHHES